MHTKTNTKSVREIHALEVEPVIGWLESGYTSTELTEMVVQNIVCPLHPYFIIRSQTLYPDCYYTFYIESMNVKLHDQFEESFFFKLIKTFIHYSNIFCIYESNGP